MMIDAEMCSMMPKNTVLRQRTAREHIEQIQYAALLTFGATRG
jgi:hypothetical protein